MFNEHQEVGANRFNRKYLESREFNEIQIAIRPGFEPEGCDFLLSVFTRDFEQNGQYLKRLDR